MQVFQLSGQTSVTDIAAEVYGLKAADPALATATRNLVVANPALGGNVSALPKGTLIAVPLLNGAPATRAAAVSIDPLANAYRKRLQNLGAAATLAASQRGSPSTATAPLGAVAGAATTAPSLPALDFTVFQQDLAAFLKIHLA
jgi:hypothetical protein